MYPAKNNDRRLRISRLLGKTKRVSNIVRQILNFGILIIMNKNYCIQLIFETNNLSR